jgi:DNA polymerase
MIEVPPDGPIPSRLMIVGEAPGADEVAKGKPFVGALGFELNKMLAEAGLSRSASFVTNVARTRPQNNDISLYIAKAKKNVTPRHSQLRDKYVTEEILRGVSLLKQEIDLVKPDLIIALGNVPLWALTGRWGITKWRGSMLQSDLQAGKTVRVIPTIHPASVLRQWSQRGAVITDLRRAAGVLGGASYSKPAWNFRIRPTFDLVTRTLSDLIQQADQRAHSSPALRISFDLETSSGHIACAGISWTLTDSLCIPFMYGTGHYWTVEQEFHVINLLCLLLTHRKVEVVGQNISYDCQYTWRHWFFIPNVGQDCMIGWHSIYSDLPKALAFQASMTCEYYVYWKDEGKFFNPKEGPETLWYYNCEDTVYTDEVGQAQYKIAEQLGLLKVYESQQALLWPVLRTMLRGVRIDEEKRSKVLVEVQSEILRREQFLEMVLGHKFNQASTKQMRALFYDDLKLPTQWTRATKGEPAKVTLNDDALQKLAKIEPLVQPLINAISDIRTLHIFQNILDTPRDDDGRMRCSYNIGGSESGKSAPKTYRLSSSKNAFGSGTNLQNIPSEKSKSLGKAKNRGGISGLGNPYEYPNLREIFVPDPGYTFFDGDLDRADLQVVAWETDDEILKTALRLGSDIHLVNCYALQGRDPPDLLELVETHPKYWDHRGPLKHLREFSKVFCHATNYVGSARTVASHTGRTVHEVDRAQKIWFGTHPGIKKWHIRTEDQIKRYRFVENRFGYRWYIFDRVDQILPEAVAWVPQSTVSIVINRIWQNLDRQWNPHIEVLLQVHDSLAGQFVNSMSHLAVGLIEEVARNVIVPYEDPLVIPFSVKTSTVSWGDCE